MLPKELDFKNANYFSDVLAFIVWVLILGLIVYMKMATFVFTLLFSLFVFSLVHTLLGLLKVRFKLLSSIIAVIVLSLIFYLAFISLSHMVKDLAVFFQESRELIIEKLDEFEIGGEAKHNINNLYSLGAEYLLSNFETVKNAGLVALKMTLGMVFGIIIFHSQKECIKRENLWQMTQEKIYRFAYIIFDSFKGIMTTQIIISLMNTVTISFFALVITKLYSGAYLPYWYVIIPLVAIFSLIPIVGNLMVNVLIALASLQVSLYYIFIALIYFFIVHKMELIVIGNFLHKKMDAPFIVILFSMIIGELIFTSVVGVILGMVMLFSILSLLRSFRVREE